MVCLSLARAKEKATTGLAPLFDAFVEDAAFLYGIFFFCTVERGCRSGCFVGILRGFAGALELEWRREGHVMGDESMSWILC